MEKYLLPVDITEDAWGANSMAEGRNIMGNRPETLRGGKIGGGWASGRRGSYHKCWVDKTYSNPRKTLGDP